MAKFVKIGSDLISLESISRITFVENQSGISDRILISAGGAEVVVDSGICGRETMHAIRDRFMQVLDPEIWHNGAEAPAAIANAA